MDEPTPLDADGIVGSLTLEKKEGEEGVIESDGCKLMKSTGCEGGVWGGGAWDGVWGSISVC